MAELDKICGTCLNIDLHNKSNWSDTYYCNKKYRGGYHSLQERGCSDYVVNQSLQKDNSSCYITTIVCNILGYCDNCELLTSLRNFRENFLRINPKYHDLLIEYDLIGPQISEELLNLKNNKQYCLGLVKYFLIPCTEAIKSGRFDDAIAIYINMVNSLTEEFSVYFLPTYDVCDETQIGKGRIRIYQTMEG